MCAAALAVLDEIEDRQLLANCRARSEPAADRSRIASRCGRGERPGTAAGRGPRLGTGRQPSPTPPGTLGLIVNAVRPNAVRFAPPLSISEEEIEVALEQIRRCSAGGLVKSGR